jgi:hypothetical protein
MLTQRESVLAPGFPAHNNDAVRVREGVIEIPLCSGVWMAVQEEVGGGPPSIQNNSEPSRGLGLLTDTCSHIR